jgi:septal ring factor EnvC (AmiA/AmiB activator)
MAAEQPRPVTQLDSPREVDRIRDIIFGGPMREYAQRFQTIQRDMERLQNELETLNEQLSDQGRDFDKKLQTLRKDTRTNDDDIRAELRQTADKLTDEKVDRLALGELFIELGNHLKAGGSLSNVLNSLGGLE